MFAGSVPGPGRSHLAGLFGNNVIVMNYDSDT